ncbi:MAG: hypothetical protein JST92_09730, partial [Deltaproteobacteria bacterium]|nr:hypothetical protein [Deltaproteobacteria bacterium]
PLVNGGFEDVNSSGTLGWTTSTTDKSGISPIDYDDFFGPATHQGLGMAWLGDWDNGGSTTKTTTDTLSQTFTIPSGASPVFLRFWLDAEADPGDPGDTLTVNIRTAAGTTTIATITGAQTYGGYLPFQYDISAFAGQTVKLVVVAKDTGANPQNWFMDDFSVRAYTIPPQGTPTVQAFESGVKGTISLSALVTDDHLTSKVDFSIDGNKVATVTTQPWNTTYNSASLAYGNHILTATATNSANTATTSSPVSFFIDQSQTTPSPLGNPSFEFTSGTTEATGSGVTAAPWVLTKSKTSDGNDWCNEFIDGIAYDGFRAAVFNGCGTSTAKLTQAFTVPNTTRALMSFQFAVIPEGSPAGSLVLSVRDSTCATVKTTLRTWTQADDTDFTWTTRTFDLGAYKGQQICLQFDAAQTSAVDPVRFYVDDFTWVTSTNADTAAPVVTASIDGSSGNLALHAHAVDDSKLTKVEFFIDNTSVHAVNEEGADAFEDYTYDSTGLSNGAHTLVVKATDASSNVGSSPAVNFEVHNTPPDHNAPTVTASVTGTYVMNADAHDDTAVAEVDFFIDGTFAGSATDAPYSKPVLLTLTPGTHQLVARAIDVFGNHADSAPVSFGADAVTISIDPASTNVGTGDAVTFHAVLGNTANPLVSWSVTEGASAGIIDAGGVFTAGTSTGTYHIVAHPAVAPSLTGNATVRVWTCDFDNDSNVDGLDMERFAKSFGTHTGDAAFDAQTDFNGDGAIDDSDIALFLTRFGR